jgi:hypothetical protein
VRYRHIPVDDTVLQEETYLTLALEATLIGLGHQVTILGTTDYSQSFPKKVITELPM